MTQSRDDRRRWMERALTRLFADCGDNCFELVTFASEDDDYSDFPPTTWHELVEAGDLEQHDSSFNNPNYRFTPRGWKRTAKLTGAFDSPEWRDRAERLMAALKAHIKGRREPGMAETDEIALGLGVPTGWVESAVAAGLLYHYFPNRKVNLRFNDGVLTIPPTFGMEEL